MAFRGSAEIPSLRQAIRKGDAMPNLDDVKQVVECSNQVDANQYLQLGWKLLRTYSSNVRARYVLGWTGEADAPHPEKLAAQSALEYLDSEIAKEKVKLAELESKRKAKEKP